MATLISSAQESCGEVVEYFRTSEAGTHLMCLGVAAFVMFEYRRRSRKITTTSSESAVEKHAAGLPTDMYEPNSMEALRFLLKTLALIGLGLLVGSSPSPWLLPVGITLMGVGLSYSYLVSLECSREKFFQSPLLNKLVGSAARVGVLQSWNADKLTHFTIGGCGLAFLFILIHFFGPWGVFKYWILPLLVMQVNLSAAGKNSPGSASYYISQFFPESSVADLFQVPMYKMEAAVDSIATAPKKDGEKKEKSKKSLADRIWYALPSSFVMREMFFWKKREILLQAAFVLAGFLFVFGYQTTVPASVYIPLSVILPGFLSFNRRSARSTKAPSKKKQVPSELKVILYGKVVDLTKWAKFHPGGMKPLLVFKNRDATEIFEAYHSPAAQKMAAKRVEASTEIAPPSKESERTKIIKADYKRMLGEAREKGLFNVNVFHEIAKFTFNMSLYFGGMYMIKCTEYVWTGMLVFCLAIQQFGWLAHDFSHHSVFTSPRLNDFFANIVGCFQTYNVMWWKARHNTHHVVTNEEGVDPDIQTSPLFTYIQGNPTLRDSLNWIQRHQSLYFLPSLCLLHTYWSFESLLFILARLDKMKVDLICWTVAMFVQGWVFYEAGWACFLTFSMLKGFGTGVVVFATHYGEDRLDPSHSLSLVEQTGLTSRNISGSWFMHQFCGAISYQIEHHLCPMMPRSKLPEFSPMVKAFFKKHGMEYRESSLAGCMMRNMEQLSLE